MSYYKLLRHTLLALLIFLGLSPAFSTDPTEDLNIPPSLPSGGSMASSSTPLPLLLVMPPLPPLHLFLNTLSLHSNEMSTLPQNTGGTHTRVVGSIYIFRRLSGTGFDLANPSVLTRQVADGMLRYTATNGNTIVIDESATLSVLSVAHNLPPAVSTRRNTKRRADNHGDRKSRKK